MGIVVYALGVSAAVTSPDQPDTPVRLPKCLHADTVISVAPSVGTANLVVSDPDGRWEAFVKPNFFLNIVFSSRTSQWKNLGQLNPGSTSSWFGMVNTVQRAYDPRTQYGRAIEINAWTLWKPLVVTSVPLAYFFSGQYPAPGISLLNLLSTAIQSCENNMHITIGTDFGSISVPIATSFTNTPNMIDTNDPQSQTWAVYLMAMLTAAGIESFAREDGTIVVRDFQGMQNPKLSTLPVIPNSEMFSSKGAGTSDLGLTTNVIVSWSTTPQSNFAMVAPDNGLSGVGPLPPQLLDSTGKPYDFLGQRFASYTADFINSAQAAGRYAANQRAVGLGAIDTFQAAVALNGDIRIGSQIIAPCYNRRYYVTTVGHYFEDQVDAETNISGNFGVPPNYVWNQAAMQGQTKINLNQILSPAPGQYGSPYTKPATIPLPADMSNPDVRWLSGMKVITAVDISSVLQSYGSPFANQANYIWKEGQQYGINPAFALAVWIAETRLGADGSSGSIGMNPGNLGPGEVFSSWQDGIDAWYNSIVNNPYYGVAAGNYTVNQIAAHYIPDTTSAPSQMEQWESSVSATMINIIRGATVPLVSQPTGQTAPAATGTMAAAAAYGAQLAPEIPTNGQGINNVIQPDTPLGDFVQAAGYGYAGVQCTVFIEFLMEYAGGIAGIVSSDGSIYNGPNAQNWGGSYLPNLGFTEMTGSGPLPGDVLLFKMGETNRQTGQWSDGSEGDGHVGIITAVTQPDSNNQGGTVTVAAANVPDPIDQWLLTQASGAYAVGLLANGGFFGATPFSWWRHA